MPTILIWVIVSMTISEFLVPNSEKDAEIQKLQFVDNEDLARGTGGLWFKEKDLFVKDIVVQGKVTSAGNFTIIPVNCVMFLQQSSKDYRLGKEIQDKYKFSSCCLQTPEEYEAFKKGS